MHIISDDYKVFLELLGVICIIAKSNINTPTPCTQILKFLFVMESHNGRVHCKKLKHFGRMMQVSKNYTLCLLFSENTSIFLY